MDEDNFIYRYIASFDDLIEKSVYDAQKHYYTEGIDRDVSFNPYIFLASNAERFFEKGTKTFKTTSVSKIPQRVVVKCFNQSFVVLDNARICEKIEDNIVSLYIKNRLKGNDLERDVFDTDAYYCQYHEMINIMDYKDENISQKTARFYVEYGYWHNLNLKPINGLRYIASFPELITEFATSPGEGLKHYYNARPHETKITFSPSMFIASNYEKMNSFVSEGKCIDDNKVTKYYITKGCVESMATNSFDPWTYLANNPKRIRELCTDERNFIDFQLPKIFPSNVAKMFILHNGKDKKLFESAEFVKMYIDDPDVNYDKKLNIENAAWYFCRGYITTEVVPWRLTYKYKTLMFLQRRLSDAMRQIPIQFGRIVCFS